MSELDKELKHMLNMVSYRAQGSLLDTLACYFHNAAGTLSGNTADKDSEWLARVMFETERQFFKSWEHATDQQKAQYLELAELCIQTLPKLISRMAHRYEVVAQALELLEREHRHQGEEQSHV